MAFFVLVVLFPVLLFASVIACFCFWGCLKDAIKELNNELEYGKRLRNEISQLKQDNTNIDVKLTLTRTERNQLQIENIELLSEIAGIQAKLHQINTILNPEDK